MNILIIGAEANLQECKHKFGNSHHYSFAVEHREAAKFLSSNDLVVDFIIDEEPHQIEIYLEYTNFIFFNTSKITLRELGHAVRHKLKGKLFGFNGIPTFLQLPVVEISLYRREDEAVFKDLATQLNLDFLLVDDRVGLVTPRIICMIINEAYYTVQEGTASRTDIDMAMKLGTNYPYGPFEWCERIGITHVYELLEAVYDDTRDERYKICALLKKEYLDKK